MNVNVNDLLVRSTNIVIRVHLTVDETRNALIDLSRTVSAEGVEDGATAEFIVDGSDDFNPIEIDDLREYVTVNSAIIYARAMAETRKKLEDLYSSDAENETKKD